MAAIDPKKSIDAYRAKRGEFRIVDVPPLQYLMIDGAGDPNTAPAYGEAVSALFPLAYTLKFASRSELGIDTVVMPLEGLWHASDMESFTSRRDKSAWKWTLLIMVGDHVTPEMLADAVETVAGKAAKKKEPLPALSPPLHPRERSADDGTAPRDLPERSAAHRPGEAAHHPPAAGRRCPLRSRVETSGKQPPLRRCSAGIAFPP